MLKDKNTGETWEGVIGNLPLNDSYKPDVKGDDENVV